jgi:hypothetical protein
MEVAEFLAAVVLTNFGSHLIFHAVPYYWRRAARSRRELGLRRLDELALKSHALERSPDLGPAGWQASAYRRYYVPVGLRLTDARRIVRRAHDPPAKGGSA